MTISYQTQRGITYGTICEVFRRDGKVHKVYGESLGRVIDRERKIFYNRKRGLFQYDPVNNQFLAAPPDVEIPKRKSRLKVPAQPVVYPAGDIYWLDAFMKKNKIYDLFLDAYSDKLPEIKSMICYYLTNSNSNSFADIWYQSTFAKFLFKDAKLTSQRISELLEYIGDPYRQQKFFQNYFCWFRHQYQNDDLGNILIDSTGLPNNIHFHLTAVSNHNGDINNEVRLIYVVQQSTELPIFFRCIPGNIVDITTIQRTILELKSYGINTNYSITDAGYFSEENVEFMYKNKISFLMRLQPNRKLYKKIIEEHLKTIEKDGICVIQNNRVIRVKKVACKFCEDISPSGKIKRNGFDGFAYLCVDLDRKADEERKIRDKIISEPELLDSYNEMAQDKGVFILVSKRSINPLKVIELYYTRQQIEQVFDFGKNYASMLPLSVQKEETFRGHMVLTFLATIVAKLLAMKLAKSGTKLTLKPVLTSLGYQSCSILPKGEIAITSEPSAVTRQAFKCIGEEYPVTVCIN